MSASVVTFANLGEKTNLKTAGILPVINTFIEKKELTQVICQINKNFHFPNTSSAIPWPYRYVMRILEKLSGLSLERTRRMLSDNFVRWKLQKTDIVFFHPAARFGKAIRKAKKNGSIVVGVATVAHPLFDEKNFENEYKKFGIPFYNPIFRELNVTVGLLDYVITYSDFVSSTYIEKGFPAERIFVAYSDIPLSPIVERETNDSVFKVLYVAHTDLRKGLHYLLDAWSGLQLPGAELVVVGGFEEIPEIVKKQYENTIRHNPSIRWVGYTEDTGRYYGDASIFVFPSLSEGNSKVVMEAMAYGLPVVTTTAAQSIVEDGKSGFVVPVRDANALKEKITYLYNNRKAALQMGQEARRAMENKKPFGEAVFEIYQEILKREGRRL
jgi:glycosyltransferase involved in cell wall biosynthesis